MLHLETQRSVDPALPAGDLELPRLIYLSNVPVEASYHGSALLFRLLSDYPPEKLHVLEGSTPHASRPDRRLRGVTYGVFPSGIARLLRSRLLIPYGSLLILRAASWWSRVERYCRGFRPEAVLAVAHGPLWITAAAYARQRGLPLHLICHDDIRATMHLAPRYHPWLEELFGRCYREAASRFCVSPYMREDYCQRYGADAGVLYPGRAPGSPAFTAPPLRLDRPCLELTVAFGGTINSDGYARILRDLAEALRQVGGRLLIFGLDDAGVRQCGLDAPNVQARGLLPSAEMIRACREEADALVVPMSFDPLHQQNMRAGFPSKLADYTAAGLPLLVIGPPESSAVKWAVENAPVAEVVTLPGTEPILPALLRLKEDAAHRLALAQAAIRVGEAFFAPERARETFLGAVLSASGQCLPAKRPCA
jgi:glycosyltransferase involved in cell wall biosynthesis